MTLSTSRQQFLAYETQGENIQYGRRGGVFVSYCICVGFVIFAILVAVVVGVISHFITYFKISSEKNVSFWDETSPFGQTKPSLDLRLPTEVVPSFYRLKLKVNLDNSSFSGQVAITIRAKTRVKEIILHSKHLNISNDAKLTEQIYERVALSSRSKRQADNVTGTEAVNVTEVPQNTNSLINASTISPQEASTNSPQDASTSVPHIENTQLTHSNAKEVKILTLMPSTGDRLVILLAKTLKPSVDYILELSFTGKVGDSLNGFYKSSYKSKDGEEKLLGVTQFEPTSARAAFPCFDEPAFKAKFEISIAHKKNLTVLSNMKESAEEPMPEDPDWSWTHFERSVAMSTYLVAYVICDFKSLETTYLSKDNITKTIKVWTRPELIDNANYALNITPKLLDYYEDVFGLPYALDKLDLIAIPDFASGAMENWGLITFRETALLYNSTQGIPRDKQGVAIDVAHELAHQWFGNLVTMKWWSDLWLNEGFATYIEFMGVDKIEPSWNILEYLSRDKMDLLRTDALKNTSPVARQVIDASEISQKFDEISYTKGANLIRMLNHTLTEEVFHKGLLIYLNEWKFSNAEENDLWEAMSKASTSSSIPSLVKFMNSWTRQAGYPVVNVNRNYYTATVEIEQRLFTGAKQPYQAMIDQLWQIPITYTSIMSPEPWSTLPKRWLNKRIDTFALPLNDSDAIYVNVDAVGYYRVNYDSKNWLLLSSALKSGRVKSSITKAQLIDDAFNLAKTGQLDYNLALGLTTCVMDGEDSKIVWELVLNNMGFLRYNLRATPGYVYFQDYMKLILKTQLKKLNYGLDAPKDYNEAFLIENLLLWECYVESERCLNWAQGLFKQWMEQTDVNNNPVPSFLRSLVYGVALRRGGRPQFEFLWGRFLNSSDPGDKSLIINVLPHTMDESLIATLLEKSLTEIPKQYAVAVWSVEPPLGTIVARQFLLDNYQRVYDKFTAMDPFMFPAVLNAAFGFITTNEELDTLKQFALAHKAQLVPMSQTLQKLIDTAVLRIDWIKKYSRGINHWFQDYVEGKLLPDGSTPVNTTTVAPETTTINNNITMNNSSIVPPVTTTTPTTTTPSEKNNTD